jgi:CheY-like chemotaxis protein
MSFEPQPPGIQDRTLSLSLNAARVLNAEDERDTLMTLGILVRSEGYEVQLVHGGANVADAVREFRPHIVLLDIGMPDRDGYAVASELKGVFGKKCPLLIAVTAYANAADKARARESGFDHHVAKPYDPVELLELLSRAKI